MLKRKIVGKPNVNLVKSFDSKVYRIDMNKINGFIGYINVIEVYRPIEFNGIKYENYIEINFLPDDENWQVFAYYNKENKILGWYFDITKINSVDENGNPYCDDLYLDIVLLPCGEIIIYDENELIEAYNKKEISKLDYEIALNVKTELIKNGIINIHYMGELYNKIIKYINKEHN